MANRLSRAYSRYVYIREMYALWQRLRRCGFKFRWWRTWKDSAGFADFWESANPAIRRSLRRREYVGEPVTEPKKGVVVHGEAG